jgi:hypothetical protein
MADWRLAMNEVVLSSGFVNRVVRIGDTVRRPSGPWTPAVHALLRHLEAVGFAESPRAIGIDDQGHEVLTYVKGASVGWTDWPTVMRGHRGVATLGEVLRRYHDAARGFRSPQGAEWRNPLAPESGDLIRHGDFPSTLSGAVKPS